MDNRKIELEYIVNTSPKVLFNRLSTPGGLAEWFADDVNLKGKVFTFIWNNSEQKAEIIQKKDLKHVRFRWLGDTDDYFEFRLKQDELTGDLALLITDFSDEDEQEDTIELWNSQISDLKHALGL
ncbi:MAG: START-like domain-containing protein [Bacteroidales bacterium]